MKIKLLLILLFISFFGRGQTNPTAQSLPYSQDFSTFVGATVLYPGGWQGWTIPGSLSGSFVTTAPNGDQSISVVTNAATSNHVSDFIGKLGMMSTASSLTTVCLSINTSLQTNIQVSYLAATQRTNNTRQNELGLQYRIGVSGDFIDVASSGYQNQMSPVNLTGTNSVKPETISVTLPVACENKPVVQLRWVVRDVSGTGARPGFSIDNVSVVASSTSTSEINILGNGLTIPDNDTTPIVGDNTNFGSTTVGTPIVKTFTIENTSATGALNLTGVNPYIVISGANASDFSVTTIPATPIATNSSTTFQITFNPAIAGTKVATLTIANNDSNENPYNFDITGTATGTAYCASTGNASFQTSVTNVAINTIANASTKGTGYSNYTAISTNLQQGASYPLNVRINTAGNYIVLGFAWFDFNHDLDFDDAGEAFDLGSTTNSTNGLTSLSPLSINIPATAALGNTRMRVIATYDGDSSPCLSGFDGEVEDYTINITTSCTPTHTITSFAPISGPEATEVTITGTGFTAASSVQFNGVAASVVYVNATTLIATVPAGVNSGKIKVTIAGCALASTSDYSVVLQSGTCTSGNNLTDLIISEVYDSAAGNSWYMELYNPTNTAINLDAVGANYKLVRYGDIGTTTGIRTVDISGIIPAGGIYLADLGSDSVCGALGFDFVDKANGINENDEINLVKETTVVDKVHCPNEKGYSIRRNALAFGPTATYNAADWTLLTTETCANLDLVPFTTTSSLPTVSIDPLDLTDCSLTSGTFSVAAAPSGAGVLTYQWYYNNTVSAGWQVVNAGTFSGIVASGTTSASLTLTGAIGSINNYQFYCVVTQNGSCSKVSDAAQIKVQSTSWNGTTWTNGTPDLTKTAVIDGNYVTVTNGNFSCCSLVVNATRNLTISANGYIEVQNNVTNNGVFNILNNGSLVQINDASVNTGNITMERIANVRLQDYVYWSSPVSNSVGAAVTPITSISPNTPLGVIWEWNPLSPNYNGSEGMWLNTTENMIKGKGYAVRGPSGTSNASTTPLNVNFTGVPNNGVVSINVDRGNNLNAGTVGPNGVLRTALDDNFNLIGNPYPSAIDADVFIDTYGNPAKPALYANIEGAVRIWTHGTLPSAAITDPFYANYQLNYTANDYISYNSLGAQTGPSTFNGKIAAGQGFIVIMNPGTRSTNTISFRNSLRSKLHNNGQFFKTTAADNAAPVEKHRIWLDLISPANAMVRTLVGYATNATNEKDNTFDAVTDSKNSFNLYSVLEEDVLTIQGRAVPFNIEDKVQLGVSAPADGDYKIAVATADGIFSKTNGGQKIYLEDTLLHVIHDLSTSPYVFSVLKGKVNDRFVLRYTNELLSTDTNTSNSSDVVVYSNDHINILSKKEVIAEVFVYDALGRVVFSDVNVTSNDYKIAINRSNIPLIVKIKLDNGVIINKKIVF